MMKRGTFKEVHNVDLAVGRIVAKLKELDKFDNTLIVFLSDNGPETLNRYASANRSHGSPGPLRGMKLWTTEAGFRVPGIVCWPAKITAGQTSDTPVSSLDLLPTFCELAAAPIPADLQLDGISAVRFLTENGPFEREKPLLWCYYNSLNQQRVAMRAGKWKVLAKLDQGKLPKLENVHTGNQQEVFAAKLSNFEMYDLTTDVGEFHDLFDSAPEAASLQSLLEQQFQELVQSSHVWTTVP